VIRAASLFVLAFVFAACALIREGNPVTTPDPKDYPCGVRGMLCTDTNPATCCLVGVCVDDNLGKGCDEGGVVSDNPEDNGDPTMLSKKRRGARAPLPTH
jgi:hypothetical protein